ncbi:MBL fold metallo-hydrolase [Candidatus Falkowbacteria bacterium]|nr:MBL fold metallo-hydrolase [Candidatus Falkowbacteria bacterium]
MSKKYKVILIGAFGAAVVLIAIALAQWWRGSGQLRVVACDIGQGDAILIQTPTHDDILVDGGPDLSVLDCLGRYLPFYDRTIELVVLTHPHADHLVGLVPVLERYRVERVVFTDVTYSNAAYGEFRRLIAEQQIPAVTAEQGQEWPFGSGVVVRILYPFSGLSGQSLDNPNNGSIVFQLVYNQVKFLFVGDLEATGETQLLRTGVDLHSSVLKVGHHGSSTSSIDGFLAAVRPALALISVGQDNKFGHPSLRVINRLQNMGATVRRTDRDGDVVVWSDGITAWFK